MTTMSIEEVMRSGLGDYMLQTVHWTDSEDDIILSLAPPPRNGTEIISLKFYWVTELIFNLEFVNLMGMPMLFEVTFNPVNDTKWAVVFDFAGAPRGFISFKCNAIELVDGLVN